MAKRNTRGWYYFENGYEMWVNGMSATERRNYERQYGRIIRFIPD